MERGLERAWRHSGSPPAPTRHLRHFLTTCKSLTPTLEKHYPKNLALALSQLFYCTCMVAARAKQPL